MKMLFGLKQGRFTLMFSSQSHFFHEVRMMSLMLLRADLMTQVLSAGMLLFALAFLVVGIPRHVEFRDFNFSSLQRKTLVGLHIVGCVLLSFAFALFAIDLEKRYSDMNFGFLMAAIVLLFPMQIYIGLIRRKRLREKYPEAFKSRFF